MVKIRYGGRAKEHVRNQISEDIASDPRCLRKYRDPFAGEPVVKDTY